MCVYVCVWGGGGSNLLIHTWDAWPLTRWGHNVYGGGARFLPCYCRTHTLGVLPPTELGHNVQAWSSLRSPRHWVSRPHPCPGIPGNPLALSSPNLAPPPVRPKGHLKRSKVKGIKVSKYWFVEQCVWIYPDDRFSLLQYFDISKYYYSLILHDNLKIKTWSSLEIWDTQGIYSIPAL